MILEKLSLMESSKKPKKSDDKVKPLDSFISKISNNCKGFMGEGAQPFAVSIVDIGAPEEKIVCSLDLSLAWKEQISSQDTLCTEKPQAFLGAQNPLEPDSKESQSTLKGSGEQGHKARTKLRESFVDKHCHEKWRDDPYTLWDPGPNLRHQTDAKRKETCSFEQDKTCNKS
ncbi:unnamed protein product [Rhodiola kirilowii]